MKNKKNLLSIKQTISGFLKGGGGGGKGREGGPEKDCFFSDAVTNVSTT